MSLEYKNEEPQVEELEQETENHQRTTGGTPIYSIILIASLCLVFLCQLIADGSPPIIESANNSVLLAGFVKQFFYEGQFWRILTGDALHGGITHLAFNCYALYVLGKLIETLSNRAHLAIIFLLSAIGGGILSLVFLPEVPSIGASGGIVGFLGYLTVYGYKRRKLLSNSFLKNMLFNIGFIALFGISINFYARTQESGIVPMVDNFGHLGGLLAGAIYGLIQIPADLYKDPREVSQTSKIFGVISLGVFILTVVFTILILLGVIQIPIPAAFLNE